MDSAEIERRLTFVPADEQQANDHAEVNLLLLETGHALNNKLPEGREKALAITHLEEVQNWANRAIAHTRQKKQVDYSHG